ncbi:glutathione S-transferase family protein [Pseudomaricurvus alkylphenolicus]|uniref:glutathione S-transferase family protein n=1 Tax=Pseudomaricurvus alkylphenolicus TaxID=1306991 RepID=UPI00141F1198|nr:glutathione S-transferase family protein [Pseudomaricurvus alkylphenolicus]NIB39677.1 glutathione S-transferase family protein [Pseudomaricurvus alkylphenolicus]
MDQLTLIIGNKNYSSWSLRAWLYLAVNDIAFEEIRLPLDTPEFHERIKSLSPTRCVPALHHGEVRVWDSLAIIEYIERQFSPAVSWPQDPVDKATALSAVMEMHAGFLELRNHYPMNCRKPPFSAPLRGGVQKDLDRLDELWSQSLIRSGGPALFGELSIADVYFAPVVFRLHTYRLPVSPICRDYVEWMLELPQMQHWKAAGEQEVEVVEIDEWKD